MSDIGDRLRALFDDEARPIDPTYIPHSVRRKSSVHRRFSVRPGWQIGIAAGLTALVFGGTALLLRTNSDGGTAETISATQPNEAESATSSQEASIEWTQRNLPEEFNVHTITAAGGYFFGLAWDEIEEPDPRTRLWLSEDGANWEAIDVDATAFGMRAGYFTEIAALGDGFVATVKGESLASGFAEMVVVTSPDARAWVLVADIGDSGVIPEGVAGGKAGGIAVVKSPEGDHDDFNVWHSTDGSIWTLAASRTFGGVRSLEAEFIGGRFYLWPPGDGEGLWSSSDASEWTSIDLPPLGADWSGRMLPAESPGGLLLFTFAESGSRLWLMAADNTWMEITPDGFDVPFAPSGGFGDQFISSSDGGPAVIIDDLGGGPGTDEYPTTIWWTLDGARWSEILGSEAFGSEGTIRLASAKGDTIVSIYHPEYDGVGSLWTGVVERADAPTRTTQPAHVVMPDGLPLLVLELPDTGLSEVHTIFDESTGTPIGIRTNYHTPLGPHGCYGRSTLLWIQQPVADTAQFDYLTSLAESTDIVIVGGREVTVYAIPDEAIAEGNYDLGILRWTEAPGYDVFLIPWGLAPDEALALMDRLQIVNESEWDQLVGLIGTSPTPYPVECNEPVSLMPRVVIDLPGFEIVGGSEAQDGPAHWHAEWQIRIGETTGTITLDSDQTTPSKTFVDYDNPEEVTIAAYPGLDIRGLLARYDDGFVVEWQLDTRFTVSIDGTDIDPLALIDAIRDVDETTWRQLLPDSLGIPHYTIDLTGWVINSAFHRLDGSDYVQIVKTDPEDLDHPEFHIITGPEAAAVHRQLTDGGLPSLDTRSVQGTTATTFRLLQGGSFDLLWVNSDGVPIVFEFTKVKDDDVERILSALRPMTEAEWAAESIDLSTTTSSVADPSD